MKRHYAADGSRRSGRTACGIPTRGFKGPKGGSVDPWITVNMDRVTCKRCITSWNRFMKEGGAGR